MGKNETVGFWGNSVDGDIGNPLILLIVKKNPWGIHGIFSDFVGGVFSYLFVFVYIFYAKTLYPRN